jgi:hypothetical protein
LLPAAFPALRLLHYFNKNKPAMDKIFFPSHRTTVALEKSQEHFNSESLFGYLKSDSNFNSQQDGEMIVFGGYHDLDDSNDNNLVFDYGNTASKDETEDETPVDEHDANEETEATRKNSVMLFGRQVIWHWEKRRQHIEHEYFITGWILCVMGDI